MIGPPLGARIWISAGVTDLRRGFTGLSAAVQTVLEQDPFGGHIFVFFVAGVATSLSCCGGMAMACVCFRSG
jgi:transposase